MAGRIGQPDDAHLVAGLGAPLHARHHRGGNFAGGGAGLDRGENSAQDCTRSRFSDGGVIVERMAGKKESDRVVFASQPLGRQPWLDLGQHDGRRVGRPAEHVVLADGGGLVAALACRKNCFGAGEHAARGWNPGRRTRRRRPGSRSPAC